jgi:hypothetical protein
MSLHPKVVQLSHGAFRLHISGILYANRYLTDGIVRDEIVSGLVPRFRRVFLTELLEKMLWAEVIPGEVYEIHDYLDWNRSRADVEKRRQARSDGGRKGADRRWHER